MTGIYHPTHHRRSIRLKGYDYTQAGAYFVTLVTYQRDEILGQIVDGEMQLSKAGQIVAYQWTQIPAHFPASELDAWVIMPNHLHGIIVLGGPQGKGEAYAGQRLDHPEAWRERRKGEASAYQINDYPEPMRADASPQRNPDSRAAYASPQQPQQRPIGTAAGSLGAILQNFKSVSTRKVNQECKGEAFADHLLGHPESWVAGEPHGRGEAFANRADEVSESWVANASPQHLWQRDYYEHIIRNEAEWQRIRDYIKSNPLRWQEDQLHPRAE